MCNKQCRGKPQRRERKRFGSECPAPPQGGGKPAGRRQACRAGASSQGGGKLAGRGQARRAGASPQGGGKPAGRGQARRAGASPAPTIYGLRRPIGRRGGRSLAVARDEGTREYVFQALAKSKGRAIGMLAVQRRASVCRRTTSGGHKGPPVPAPPLPPLRDYHGRIGSSSGLIINLPLRARSWHPQGAIHFK